MDQGLIPRRYAKALYEVAVSHGNDEKLYKQMQLLVQAFNAEPKLDATLNNPFVSPADKAKLVMAAANAGSDDAQLTDFVKLLEQNKRIGMVRGIALAYMQLYREKHNIYRVQVVTAAPMAQDEENRLKALIQKHLGDATMEYATSIDPDLIGGFVVNIDNERLDASVKNDLKQLRLKLIRKA